MENTLENSQPEEQHGFRKQRRIEEHLLTANLCLQKTLAANIPLWIISLDLSKAFDKVNWEALWAALMQHGVSQHLVWILQYIYYGQSGKVREDLVDSRDFGIRAGVRQGRVLSPRLFCAVLEFAMSSWRAKVETYGLNLHDGMKALLDLRFADDLLVFATSRDDTIRLLEELVTSLGQVGLKLNTSKTKILTTQAQPGSSLETSGGVTVEVLDSRCAHKWLGCMLQAAPGGNPSADLQHHLQAASRAFHANHSSLTNHQVSVKDRLTFFHAVVTPVACFAAGHRKIFKQELAALDVAHRKLLRRVVGPPAGMDWSRPWHEILHDWNVRVSIFVGQAGLKPWSHTCLEQHWKLAHYAVNLPSDRWLPRLLHWKPVGQRRVGRPRQQWDDMLRTFCRYKPLGEWELAARDGRNWETLMPDFILFCSGSWRSTFERHILLLCTGTSFSPVPFMGCLRAYRFHSLTHWAQQCWCGIPKTGPKRGRPTCCHRLVTTLAWSRAWLECTGCTICSTIFGEMLVRALSGNALELGAICCQPTSGPSVVPHSDVDVRGTSHC